MLHLEKIPAVKVCELVTANMKAASRLKLQLRWGYTVDDTIFARIVGGEGQVLHEQFYLGEELWPQIEALHADFDTILRTFNEARRVSIQRRWNERRNIRAHYAFANRQIPVINLYHKKKQPVFSLARLLAACFG